MGGSGGASASFLNSPGIIPKLSGSLLNSPAAFLNSPAAFLNSPASFLNSPADFLNSPKGCPIPIPLSAKIKIVILHCVFDARWHPDANYPWAKPIQEVMEVESLITNHVREASGRHLDGIW